jgi:large subunit ribosomal protein L3
MALGVIARKVGMSRTFLPTGEAVAVTYLKVEDNTVVRTKTQEKDGYTAIVLGIGEHVQKTRKGAEHKKYKVQKEFTIDSLDNFSIGTKVTVEAIPAESKVTITGTSKGKGFAGVMKRWGFAGGPASHGSHFIREPGSVGMRTMPGRILKGKKLPGHMGFGTITLKGRPVIISDTAEQLIAIKGAVPGANGQCLFVTLESPSSK